MLLRDLQRDKDAQIAAVVDIIARAQPDILVVQGIDWDLSNFALSAFASRIKAAGLALPHQFSAKPNRGIPSGFDLNDNGRLGDPQDAIGYGQFTGQNGIAVLARAPIAHDEILDFTQMLWSDLPRALLPYPGQPTRLSDVMPLSSTNHWLVPIDTGNQGRVWIGGFGATTPVFDGPEDRNGRRNHDETLFWTHLLDGTLPNTAPKGLILTGNANLDPKRGDGRQDAIRSLLAHPNMQDPKPNHNGDTATVDFGEDSAGKLRVGYVLPDQNWDIVASGIEWSEDSGDASRHRLVWVDVDRR
ncbi:MAG: endonuclease/exonuclease/phosphatase family protein [Aliishimia sp.]